MTEHEHGRLQHILDRERLTIARIAIAAHKRGREWGILIADPLETGFKPDEISSLPEMREPEAAFVHGVLISIMPILDLLEALPEHDVAAFAPRLLREPPPDHVHVLGRVGCDIITLDAPVRPEWVEQEERIGTRHARIDQMIAALAPHVGKMGREVGGRGTVLVGALSDDPIAGKLALVEIAPGLCLRACTLSDVIASLPMSGEQAVARLMKAAPAGFVTLVVVFDEGFSIANVSVAS
jgi:hypothetical protein